MNKIINYIKDLIIILTHPDVWLQLGKYDKSWDKELNTLIKIFEFKETDGFTAKIGAATVWVANYPYSCMTVCSLSSAGRFINAPNLRPKRATIIRAYRKLLSDLTITHKDLEDIRKRELEIIGKRIVKQAERINELKQKLDSNLAEITKSKASIKKD